MIEDIAKEALDRIRWNREKLPEHYQAHSEELDLVEIILRATEQLFSPKTPAALKKEISADMIHLVQSPSVGTLEALISPKPKTPKAAKKARR